MTLFLFGCLSSDDMVHFTLPELTYLLATDSSKSWILTNRTINDQAAIQECEKDDRLTFSNPGSVQDSLNLQFVTGMVRCSQQIDSIIFQGFWTILDTPNAQVLIYMVNNDTLVRSVELITSKGLRLSYSEADNLIIEELAADPD